MLAKICIIVDIFLISHLLFEILFSLFKVNKVLLRPRAIGASLFLLSLLGLLIDRDQSILFAFKFEHLVIFATMKLICFWVLLVRSCRQEKRVLMIWLMSLLVNFFLLLNTVGYSGGGWTYDWFMHFSISRMFAGQIEFGPEVFSRMPGYNLVQAMIFSLVGADFWVYQFTNMMISSYIIFGIYALGCQLLCKNKALVAICLLSVNPWVFHLSWFPWPKISVSFYCCLAMVEYFHYKKTRGIHSFIWIGFFLGVGYFFHPIALFMGIGFFVDLCFCDRTGLAKKMGMMIISFLVIPACWYVGSPFLLGTSDFLEASPVMSYDQKYLAGISVFTFSKIQNFICSLLPYLMPGYLMKSIFGEWNTWMFYYLYTCEVYNSLLGMLNLSGLACFGYFVFKGSIKDQAYLMVYKIIVVMSMGLLLSFVVTGAIFICSKDDVEQIGYSMARFNYFLVLIFCYMIVIFVFYRILRKRVVQALDDAGGLSLSTSLLRILVTVFVVGMMIHPGFAYYGAMHSATPMIGIISIIMISFLYFEISSKRIVALILGLCFLESLVGKELLVFMQYHYENFLTNLNAGLARDHDLIFLADALGVPSWFSYLMSSMCTFFLFLYIYKLWSSEKKDKGESLS